MATAGARQFSGNEVASFSFWQKDPPFSFSTKSALMLCLFLFLFFVLCGFWIFLSSFNQWVLFKRQLSGKRGVV